MRRCDVTWAAIKFDESQGEHSVVPHYVPPQLVRAVLRDLKQRHGVERPLSVELKVRELWIDYGGMVFVNEPKQASSYLLAGGTRKVGVMAHHRCEFLAQLRRRLDDPKQIRTAGARWPWVKIHLWPSRCAVLYLSEARRLVAELAEQEDALRLGDAMRMRRAKKALSGIPGVVVSQ